MVQILTELLARARSGEITGLMHTVSCPEEPDESGICGAFSDDLTYAVTAAQEGFGLLIGHKDRQKSSAKAKPTFSIQRPKPLPRRLRRA